MHSIRQIATIYFYYTVVLNTSHKVQPLATRINSNHSLASVRCSIANISTSHGSNSTINQPLQPTTERSCLLLNESTVSVKYRVTTTCIGLRCDLTLFKNESTVSVRYRVTTTCIGLHCGLTLFKKVTFLTRSY